MTNSQIDLDAAQRRADCNRLDKLMREASGDLSPIPGTSLADDLGTLGAALTPAEIADQTEQAAHVARAFHALLAATPVPPDLGPLAARLRTAMIDALAAQAVAFDRVARETRQ